MIIPEIWFGDERSFVQHILRLNQGIPEAWMRDRQAQLYAQPTPDEEDLSLEDRMALELIEVYDNVGLISISGSLTDEEKSYNKWYGAVAYQTIARALSMLTEDGSISDIVMSYSTGGGTANKISELSDSIDIARTIKPVYAWTGSSSLSAGYWLASSADKFYATKMAQVGSIGAISTFTSVYRMLEEMGIDAYVARSAPKKAIPHPLEKLTEAGKQKLQNTVDSLHAFFIDHIVGHRPGLSTKGAEKTWASGDVFFAQEGIEMGLVDGPVKTLNSLISELNANSSSNQEDHSMPQHVVLQSEQDRARLAAGATVPTDIGLPGPVTTPSAEQAGESETDTELQAADEAGTEDGNSTEEAETAAQAPSNELSAYLQSEVLGLKEENKGLQAQIAELEDKLKDQTALAAGQAAGRQQLRPVAEQAVTRLHVALGHRPVKLENLPDDSLNQLFMDLNTELQALPVGQQSETGEGADREDLSGAGDSIALRRLRLVSDAK